MSVSTNRLNCVCSVVFEQDDPDEQTDEAETCRDSVSAADTNVRATSLTQSDHQARHQSAYGAWQTVQQDVYAFLTISVTVSVLNSVQMHVWKCGNVRELSCCQGNVRELTKSQQKSLIIIITRGQSNLTKGRIVAPKIHARRTLSKPEVVFLK